MERIFNLIKTRIEEESKDYPIKDIVQCGSSAKGTSVDNSDIDIFVCFEYDYDTEKFPDYIKGIAGKLFDEYTIKHGEFPYIEAPIPLDTSVLLINIVPCHYTESVAEIKSPTDRTPHHVTWVNENLNKDQKEDVKKLKEFLKLEGIYGADSDTKGFSGYLCEVLIYIHESFDNLIIDFAHTEETDFNKYPYYITDPIDSSRKLSAAVSHENWGRLILACRNHLKYNPPQIATIEYYKLHSLLNDHIILIHQPHEELAKVRKETKKIAQLLIKKGFVVYTYDSQPQLGIILLQSKILPTIYLKDKLISIVSKDACKNIGKINGEKTLKILINDDLTISALKFRDDVIHVYDVLRDNVPDDYLVLPNDLENYQYKKYLTNMCNYQ